MIVAYAIGMNKRTQRKLLDLIVTLVILLVGAYVVPRIESESSGQQVVLAGMYRISQFNDGDTITVEMAGKSEKIRMIGVDTPETEDPRKPVQCYGKAASAFTRQLIGDQPVRLEADPLNTNRDRYNRLLRYVYLADGRMVNAELILQGYGFAYTSFPFTKIDEFKQHQNTAREENRGLWNACDPEPNQYGGYTSNPE